uniref:SGNH hydrolase-type esterase domain-containing protein n=1 Tax=Pundamilia nyererei TaxID=303518 RepID=A0A3B4GIV5_9CICH
MAQPAPWTVVETRGGCRRARRIRLSHPHPSGAVVLENKFNVLDPVDFPPLAASPRHPAVSLRSAPSPPLRPRSLSRQPDARVSDGQQPPVAPPLSTLVLGDSVIRNVRMRGALTLSFPGATVVDIVDRIPNILASHPQANWLIIHIGTNDIPKQQSELMKLDFLQLFSLLGQLQVSAFISGPTPTCGRGIGRFSRLLSLNTWLSSACVSHGVGFINNFDAFWERRHQNLFGADGLHLNTWGSLSWLMLRTLRKFSPQ